MKKAAFLQVYSYFDKKIPKSGYVGSVIKVHKLSFFFERTVNINIQCRCLDCVWLSDNITYEKSATYEKSRDIKSRNLEIGYKSGSKIWVNVWTCHVSLHPVGRFCLIWQ